MAIQQLMISQAPSSGGTDPNFASVTSLIHFDAADGTTTFTDQKGFNWTRTGIDLTISTADFKFGGSSARYLFATSYLSTPSATKFAFGSSAFTIECWIKPNSSSFGNSPNLFSTRGGGSGITFRLNTSGQLEFFWGEGNDAITGTTVVSTSAFSHVALTRSSNTVRLFLNGVVEATTTVSGSITTGQSATAYMGADAPTLGERYAGFIDDFRVTNGVARYTSNFTPPTAAFPNS